ncbi:MAG: site-specific integrase [Planctomycetes bacterium]|nr:site-specific integrase [Planctomycetota bacterium]
MNEQGQAPPVRTRKARREHVYLDTRTGWWIMDFVDAWGRRHREKAARTRELATQVRRKRLDEVDRQKAGLGLLAADLTFPVLIRKYRESVLPKKSPTTIRREEEILPRLEATFGDRRLLQVTQEDVEAFQSRRKDQVSAATVNREMIVLRRLLSKAVEWRYLWDSPARRVKQLREQNRPFRYLTREEADTLVAACVGHVRVVVLVALHSGLRRGELLALRWRDIDFARGVLTVANSKSGRMRHIPMNETLREALHGVERIVGSPYVFCNADGKPYGTVKTGFWGACRRAGLEGVRFHDLRHTFASWLVIEGKPLAVVRELLGHASFEMTLRYAHLAPDQKADAVASLDRPRAVS